MMEKFVYYLIPNFINFLGITYIQSKILNKKINFNKSNTYIGIFLFLVLNEFNYIYITGFIRFVINTIIIVLTAYIIFKDNIDKIFIAVLLEQVIYFFSEFISVALLVLAGINPEKLNNNLTVFIVLNIVISIVSISFFIIPIIKKIINNAISYLSNISSIRKYVLALIFLITLNVLLVFLYFFDNKYIILINTIFVVIYALIMYIALNEKSENIKYKEQNKMLIDNLNEYEKMLDYQRVNNHENKNQLLVIQGMIDKTNTKALEYLDEVIKEKREDDEGIYTSASIIPQGGLQGLVYQKMLKMKENNITINLKVERKVRKINLDNLPSKTNYDLCRAVGIIIDNAIEENLNLKEREILICMYILDEYLVIEVSNKCSVIPDMTRLDEKGYTTKSNGHGYGLSLLKEIVDSNKNIINERSINKDIFTQIIKIKK